MKKSKNNNIILGFGYWVFEIGFSWCKGKIISVISFPKQKSTRRKQCFVFHDVDLLPLNAQNLYACSNLPIHLSAFVDTFRFNLPYSTLFGGALAISQEIFEAVNGFSNQFSGWGGEDDDFWLNRHSDPKSIIQFIKSAILGHLF